MKIAIAFLFILCNSFCLSQIKNVEQKFDGAAFFKWPGISESCLISNNGHFVLYSIRSSPQSTLDFVVKPLLDKWEMPLKNISKPTFTNDSRYLVYRTGKDTLCLFNLLNSKSENIAGVNNFKLFMSGSEEWIAYKVKNADEKLVLRSFSSGKEISYDSISNFIVSESGNTMVVVKTSDSLKGNRVSIIKWINLQDNSVKQIWHGTNSSSLLLDAAGSQLTFLNQDEVNGSKNIWIYRAADSRSIKLVSDNSLQMPENMEIAGLDGFSKNGQKVLIKLRRRNLQKSNEGTIQVNIWSYKDDKLQSQQLNEWRLYGNQPFLFALDVSNPLSIIQLQKENEKISTKTEDFILLSYRKGEESENYWNKEGEEVTWLVSVKDGKREKISLTKASFSPNERYIIGYDTNASFKNLFVYEIATHKIRNITGNIPIPLRESDIDMLWPKQYRGLGIGGWMLNDSSVIINDYYDLWQVDPSGKFTPVRLTNGRNKNWQFKLHTDYFGLRKPIDPNESLILKAFNKETKQSGFYQFKFGAKRETEKLFTGDYVFEMMRDDNKVGLPIKARDTSIYLVMRQSSRESPNIFYTTDFKTFSPVSNLYPERKTNWFYSELINFISSDKTPSQAILYKPDNFDSTKKYPLLIHYYDKMSDELNNYQRPVLSNGGGLDVAWFVGHGYLVLLADIHYKIGETGESALKSVTSAAQFISQRPYVDKNKIGIQGHSFGGYETNYIVTHSNLFAAAVSSSAPSDLVSHYASLWPDGRSGQEYLEVRRLRIGTTPWENPNLYIKNSPVFFIDRVKTPVLLVHNKKDLNVHFQQGIEFFTGLRRARKIAWMLEYDNGGHGVDGEDYKDYLIRQTQFFNHYLKSAPAPIWMTQGIPARLKSTTTGYPLDPTGTCSPTCKICKSWNDKMKKDSVGVDSCERPQVFR